MKEMSLLQDPDAVEITGTIERVVFHNEENGYTVLRLMPGSVNSSGGDGGLTRPRESVSCVGHMVNPQAGVQMKLSGRWVNNTRFGRQVEFGQAEEMMPATSEGIRLYLASGLIKGVGGGLVFRTGVSGGGMDIVIAVLRKRYGIEVGRFSFYINMLILGGSMGIVGMEKMLYGFVASYVSGQSIDSVLSSFDKRRLVLIMAKDTKPVVRYISDELRRGSTVLYGEGGFSGEERPTIMCLLTPRQTMVLKRYLAKNHPKSFMVVSEASEVLGKGFKHWKQI